MPAAHPKKRRNPTVSVVGSGRLGTALARVLSLSGYEVEAVVARRPSQARRASALLNSPTLALGSRQLTSLPSSKIIFITTPDDDIARTAATLALAQRDVKPGRTVLHTSGALSSSESLAPLKAKGFNIGSLHPLVSVSDPLAGSEMLRGAFYCVEGDHAAKRVALSIVKALKGHSFQIPSRQKPLYHAAAVMASGHITALFDLATELLTQCGLDSATARRVFLPLLETTVANLSASEASEALTGTFARGDLATVKRHLHALSGKQFVEALAAYKLLGRRSLELAKKQLDPRLRKQILRALK